MEKTLYIFRYYLIILLYLILFTWNVSAQWQPDVCLSSSYSRTSYNNARCIESNSNFVHVVWNDRRDGDNGEIYYKRSIDAGLTWGADTRLTNNPAYSNGASIAVSGSSIYIVWIDNRDGNYEIYYKRSTDDGENWGEDKRLTNGSANSYGASIAVSGSTIHIVWADNRDGNSEIYYKRSTDAGLSWGEDIRLTNNAFSSAVPSITVSGNVVHIVWSDDRSENWEIYYKRSTDGGLSWGADIRLTFCPIASAIPSISVFNSIVHIVWRSYRDGNWEIYYKRSTDGGINWGQDTRLTNNPAFSDCPSVSATDSNVHIVWNDNRDYGYNPEIYYKFSTDSGMNWGADTRLTYDPAGSYFPFISVSGTVVNVIWFDQRNNTERIYYKRNPTGNPVNINNTGSKTPENYFLSQNYPNPFNPSTTIKFSIPQLSSSRPSNVIGQGSGGDLVTLKIYNILGKEVATLVNEKLQPGTYEVSFSINQHTNNQFSSGVYFYKLVSEDYSNTKKMLLIK